MKKLRVKVLMDEDLVPPESLEGYSEKETLAWRTEFDVLTTLREMGHIASPLPVSDDLGVIRRALVSARPHIVFNLLEEFQGVGVYDQHVVAYLVLMKQPYTGCNPRGLMLAHDKALSKEILSYHRIPTPKFVVYRRGKSVKPPRKGAYPLLVKSVIEEASLGISQASIVHSKEKLIDRVEFVHQHVKSDALVEEFIEGRELYVGVIGNDRLQTLPIWELLFTKTPEGAPRIATAKVKWDTDYQERHGITTRAARNIPPDLTNKIRKLCKRIYRVLHLSGYARMDLRLTPDGRIYVLEANPNPNLTYGEDFAESAEKAGISYEALIQRILNLGLRYKPSWAT